MPDNEFLNMQEAWSFCLSLTKKIVEEYSMMNKADRLVKEIELNEIQNKELLNDVYLLQYRFQECRSTKVAIEMDLDLLARIRNRLELAEINNAGFNKEIDKIQAFLIDKLNWFKEQEKMKEGIKCQN